jgi:blue light- and temperature-responsive anti-repressor
LRFAGKPFAFAFQPIVDIDTGTVFAYEALIRGVNGEGAAVVLAQYAGESLLRLDHEARCCAIQVAASLDLRQSLSLNFSPAVLEQIPDSIGATIAAATDAGLSANQLILEATEAAVIKDPGQFAARINSYRRAGVRLAIDDFGAGYAGLNLLAEFQPDIVKIDMGLVRGIESSGPRQSIARAIIQVCDELGLDVIVEGVETRDEFHWFAQRGARLFQGFFFAKPAFEELAKPAIPRRARRARVATPD